MTEMTELQGELLAAPVNKWMRVPYTPYAQNHHKWWLHWHRYGEHGRCYFFSFVSPASRRYTYYVADGVVTGADVAIASGTRIASYYSSLGDEHDKLDAVLRITPSHVSDRLVMLLHHLGGAKFLTHI